MDEPLFRLAKAANLKVSGTHEWPDNLSDDIADFVKSGDSRAMFVVEQTDGLVIGPPPQDPADTRVLAICKPSGPLNPENWDAEVAVVELPLNGGTVYTYLHAIISQVTIPLFDTLKSLSSVQARHKLVEAERALSGLLTHSHVAFVDLEGGDLGQNALKAMETGDLNELQSILNTWKQQITNLTASDRDPRAGSASEEVGFWIALEAALKSAQEQLESDFMKKVWQSLETGKRFHATHNFAGDTGLPTTLAKVQLVNTILLKDLPVGDMIAANSIEQLYESLDAVFGHLQRKLRASGYGSQRGVALVEVISLDFAKCLQKICEASWESILDAAEQEAINTDDDCKYSAATISAKLSDLIEGVNNCVNLWGSQTRDFATLARDLMRKSSEKYSIVRIQGFHTALVNRLKSLGTICWKHADLEPLILENREQLISSFEEIVSARQLLTMDNSEWQRLGVRYGKASQQAESTISDQLKSKLESASGDIDLLLQTFEDHKMVLARPQVRAAAHSFQAMLLNKFREDLASLNTLESEVPSIEDNILEHVVKVKQINLRTKQTRDRLSIIMGSDWQAHADGAQIAKECDSIDEKYNLDHAVEVWSTTIQQNKLLNTDTEHTVLTVEDGSLNVWGGMPPRPQDAKALRALGLKVKPTTYGQAERLSYFYNQYLKLDDSIETLAQIAITLHSHPRVNFSDEIIELSYQVFGLISTGLNDIKWKDDDLDAYINAMESLTQNLDTMVRKFVEIDDSVTSIFETTSTNPNFQPEELISKVHSVTSDVKTSTFIKSITTDLALIVDGQIRHMLQQWKPRHVIHRVDIRNDRITVQPKPEEVLSEWLESINALLKPSISKEYTSELKNAYIDALKLLFANFNQLSKIVGQVLDLQILWDVHQDMLIMKLGDDVQLWTHYLEELVTNFTSIKGNLSSASYEIDILSKATIFGKCQQYITFLALKLAELYNSAVESYSNEGMTCRTSLELSSLDSIGQLMPSLTALSNAENMIQTLREYLPLASHAERILNLVASEVTDLPPLIGSSRLQSEINSLEILCTERVNERDTKKPELIKEIQESCRILARNVANFHDKWVQRKPVSGKIVPEDAISEISKTSDSATVLLKSYEDLILVNASLGCSAPDKFTDVKYQITGLLDDCESLNSGWQLLRNLHHTINSCLDSEFMSLELPVLTTTFANAKKSIEELPDVAKDLGFYEVLRTQIAEHSNQLPTIAMLKITEAWTPQHLATLLSISDPETLSIKQVLANLPDIDVVKSAIESAEGEFQLKSYIQGILNKWKDNRIVVKNVILDLDVYLQLVKDNLNALHAMRASPYFPIVASDIRQMEQQFTNAKLVFDLLIDVQEIYLNLKAVLSSPNVSTILPQETKRFLSLEAEFHQLFARADSCLPLEFASTPRLSVLLSRLASQLKFLHKSLAGFLESQRKRFPRLWFVGDDDVLEIVAQSIDIWGPKHLISLFPGVSRLDLGSPVQVVSAEGEHLTLNLPQNHRDLEPIEFLIELENAISAALKTDITNAIDFCRTQWPFTKSTMLELLEGHTIQASLVGLRTLLSDRIISNTNANFANDYTNLSNIVPEIGDGSLIWSRRRESIVTELTYCLNCTADNQTAILNVLTENTLIIKFGTQIWEYGFEYLGCLEPLVRTNVTDHLYTSATLALAEKNGLSIVGPAGTGKTESVKALGSIFGRRCIVFNCDSEFDTTAVTNIITGAASTNSWVCFDEFNRLERKVLSGIAPILSVNVRKTAIFVTMNPGYKGRTLLPPNMRTQFREFLLSKPDALTIAKVLLQAQGSVSPWEASSLVDLLATLRTELTYQLHYDWGLRTLKSIVRMLRSSKLSVNDASEMVIRPRLVHTDKAKFDLITKLDPKSIKPDIEYLKSFIQSSPGVILLGPPYSGKSTLWKQLATELNAESIICDPSAMSKNAFVGKLNTTTREWEDGLLTKTLRRIVSNRRNEMHREFFIVFDGEIEPEWAEMLNSVLDDTRQLTLSSGEIIFVPANVHFIFETSNLQSATPATISRCSVICMDKRDTSDVKIPPEVINAAKQVDHVFPNVPGITEFDMGNKYLSMLWTLAGDSDHRGREFMSNSIRNAFPDVKLPNDSLSNYCISELTNQWHSWKDTVTIPQVEYDAILKPDSVISTVETAANEYILAAALTASVPLMLVGPPGSGKTMTLLNALRQTPELDLIAMSLSSSTDPDVIIQTLEMHCEYTYENDNLVLSPMGQRRAALFMDEINLPDARDTGVVPVLQLIRSFVEFGGFYNRQGVFVKLERIQYVGACNPPPLRRDLPARFLKNWLVISVNYPDLDSLRTIYSAYLSTFGADIVLEPMLKVYQQLQTEMPEEIWTPRELTRWTRAIFVAYNSTSEAHRTPELLAKLFVHEGERVLGDRMLSNKITLLLETESKAISTSVQFVPVIWTSLLSQRPKFVSFDQLSNFLQARLSVFTEEAAFGEDVFLVAHNDFLTHVTRVDRILRQPQGHALLRGPPAVGKNTVVRFACWLSGLDTLFITSNNRYTDLDFSRDLRSAVLRSLRHATAIVMADDLLDRPEFVERTNALLANGESPNLFSNTEQLQELENAAKRAGFSGTDLNIWVRSRVVDNLHAVFLSSNETSAALSPALLNRCTINYVTTWSLETKLQIAKRWCSITDLSPSIQQALAQIPTTNGRQFVDLCKQFVTRYNAHKLELESSQRHFFAGNDRLKLAVLEIHNLKRDLNKQQTELQQKTEHSSSVLAQMLAGQSEAERKRVAAVEIRSALKKQAQEIDERQQQADKDLSSTKPLIMKAAEGVKNINKSQLNELRSLTNPPEVLKMTMESVCIVLGLSIGDNSWKQVLAQVRGDEFIPRIVNFDTSELRPEALKIIEQRYMTRPEFNFERVNRASKAGGPLLQWVIAQVSYFKALYAIEPLLQEKDRLTEEANRSQAQLTAIESMLVELETSIESSKREYSTAVAQCETLKSDMHSNSLKITRAESLLDSLSSEQNRWKVATESFPAHQLQLPGNTLLESVQLSCCGELDPAQRSAFLAEITSLLGQYEVTFTSPVTEISNSQIVRDSCSVVLIVDPSGKEIDSLTNDESNTVTVSSFLVDQDTLVKQIDTALRFGQHLIIQNSEHFDHLVTPLVRREFVKKGSRLLARLNNTDIDVSPRFKLTLQTRDIASIRKNFPLLPASTTVVDYTVTYSAFNSMIIDALLTAKHPELATKRTDLKRVSTETKSKLERLESKLLESLGNPENVQDGLLNNLSLCSSLETLKSEVAQLNDVQSNTSNTLAEIESAREEFKLDAEFATEIYKRATQLLLTNKFYNFSVQWMWAIASFCAQSDDFKASFKHECSKRLAAMVNKPDHFADDHLDLLNTEIMPLIEIIKESVPTVPVLAGLASPNTEDPGNQIQLSLQGESQSCSVVAIGGTHSSTVIDRSLAHAMEFGEWLVIQNIEIADENWLKTLWRKLSNFTLHSDFRLVLTGLQHVLVQVPDLVAATRPVSIEREVGVKLNIENLLPSCISLGELKAAYFYVCISEKFRPANFSLTDLQSTKFVFENWQDAPAFRVITDAIYGSRIDNLEFLAKLFDQFTDSEFDSTEKLHNYISTIEADPNWFPVE